MTFSKPPSNLADFQRRIDGYRRSHENIAPARLHQRISSELFFGVLGAAKDQGLIPLFLLKGGMAMELRFGIRARASGDVDIGIVAPPGELIPVLDSALALGFAGFTFRRKDDPIVLENANTLRIEVQIAFKGRVFSVLNVDLNEATYESSSEVLTTGVITELGLPGPLSVPTLEPYLQIAQKLHGATEPSRADYTNNRYRDLVDVLIFARNTEALAFPVLRRVAAEEFSRRQFHRHWPPVFSLPNHWIGPVQNEARSAGFELTGAGALEAEFLRFIATIEGIPVKDHYEYRFVSLQLNLVGAEPIPQETQNELRQYEGDGWRVIHSTLRPGYADQMLFVLERGGPLPRLQLRMETRSVPGQPLALVGELRNVSDQPANKVRLFMTGAEVLLRFGNITNADGPLAIQLPFENEPARTQQQQMPGVFAQYLTDDGRKIVQSGSLNTHQDEKGYSYTLKGLDAPRLLERFSQRHDPWEEQ